MYLDDIIVYSNNTEQHVQRLGKVLLKLEVNLYAYIQLLKCVFALTEAEYPSHM